MKISEVFRSIQGESSFQGIPTCFIRLAGCNLACSYCDTGYAKDEETGFELSPEKAVDRVLSLGSGPVCVTGGEPLLQDETPELVGRLLKAGRKVLVETNGSLDIRAIPEPAVRIIDIKSPASLMSHTFLSSNFDHLRPADEIKLVLKDREDYLWAKKLITERGLCGLCTVLMSNAYETLPPSNLAEWILEDDLEVRLNLQLHKYIWDPNCRGV